MVNIFTIKERESAILEACLNIKKIDPVDIALDLMKRDFIRMHGPEHHFLTAASLATAYCNFLQKDSRQILEKLQVRCSKIMPAVCAYYGVCGNVLAAGAVISVLLNSTYLSKFEWQVTQKVATVAQMEVSKLCGPRCCKSTTLTVLHAAVKELNEKMGVDLPYTAVKNCSFSNTNQTCHGTNCVNY